MAKGSIKQMGPIELGDSGYPEAIPVLAELIKSGKREHKKLAVSAIRKLYTKHGIHDADIAYLVLQCALKETKQIRHYALSALAKLPVNITIRRCVQTAIAKIQKTDPRPYNRKAAHAVLEHYELAEHEATAREFVKTYNIQRLFHFTDRSNIPFIVQEGGLFSAEMLAKRQIVVPRPGGNEWSREADQRKRLQQYVHLSFLPDHPMQYVAIREERIEHVEILEIDPEVLLDSNVAFTDDIANKSGVNILALSETFGLIDYEVIYNEALAREGVNVKERKNRARRAEVLIPDRVPLNMIHNI